MQKTILRLTLIFEGGLFLLACLAGWILGEVPWVGGSGWPSVATGLAATLPAAAALFWLARSGWPPVARLMQEVEGRIAPLFARAGYLELAGISLLAGLGEETFFRGLLQAQLSKWLDPWLGLALASALFGAGHLITPAYAVVAGLIGLYLGTIFLLTGDLLAVIVAHALYDFLALLYLTDRTRSRAPGAGP